MTLPVNVAGHIRTLEDMEGSETSFAADGPVDGEGTTGVALEQSLNHVRTGRQSLRVDYTAREGLARLNRRWLEDEVTRDIRGRALSLGFMVLMLASSIAAA